MASRITRWLPAAVAPVAVGAAVALPLTAASAAPDLPEKTPQQVLELLAEGRDVAGFSGVVEQTSALGLPELPTTGQGSDDAAAEGLALLTGSHTARVYAAGDDRLRVQVLDDRGERDLVRNGSTVWLWDSAENTATNLTIEGDADATAGRTATTPAEAADRFLDAIDDDTAVTVSTAQSVAGRDAYSLVLTPESEDTTVGTVSIAVDAETGLPLRVQVVPKGSADPAFAVGFTSLTVGTPDVGFDFVPPAGATVEEQTVTKPEGAPQRSGPEPEVTGDGWDAVVELPVGSEGLAEARSSSTFDQLTERVDGGNLLSTTLVNVLVTDDGRVLAGAVPVERLQAVAAG